ncbi:MAG: hypothetical protein LBT10_04245 [Methanobrevibacter sp.]|jgi:hypothetical protein|nr:hypothetical protein [Methanobrevibacter sp.]
MKSKIIGLLIIILFICSAIPAASAEEKQAGAATDLLATKTPTEIFDLVGNGSATPEIPGYDYMTNVLGTNISMAEYIHILDVIQNQSLQTEGADFYMAYISKPDEVFVNPYINDTPKNLINKIPYYKSTVNSWDRIITNYGKMDYHDRIWYLNTIGLDSDSVANLYKTSDINTIIYMLNQSSSTLDELNSVDFDKSSAYWIGHIGEAKSKGNQISSIMEKFNNKSVFAYNEYTYNYIDRNSTFNIDDNVIFTSYTKLSESIDKLNTVHNRVVSTRSNLNIAGGVLVSAGIILIMESLAGPVVLAIRLIIGIVLVAVGAILLSLAGCLTPVNNVLVNKIDLLTSYRDALPH